MSINNNHNSNDSFTINPSLKIDHIHLKVSNLKESVNFYQSILGFRVLKEESTTKTAFLASSVFDTDITTISDKKEKASPLLILTEIYNNGNKNIEHKSIKKEAGLYHFAILLPERKYLAAFLRHMQENLDPVFFEGMADHAVSESIYIHDPDFNGIEVYRDRLSSDWTWHGNKVYMITESLNVKDLFIQNPHEIWTGLPSATTIGHVHLHISNLNKSKKFYQDVLGLYHTASYPGANFFAADHYHHHVATNTWLGTNIAPAIENSDIPGLDHYAVRISNDIREINDLKRHFINLRTSFNETMIGPDVQYKDSFYVYDPDKIKIQFLFS
jgi:catechol 2,3-dioxygenase